MKPRLLSAACLTVGAALVAAGLAVLLPNPTPSIAAPPQDLPPFEDFACLDCHTDKKRLTELAVVAKPEEEAETLSSGPG